MYELKENKIYKISKIINREDLSGKRVIFLGYTEPNYFDIRRAKVKLLNKDGSCGEEWLIKPYYIIPI